MLHLTNGDSVVELLDRSEVPGRVVPWRDVLHEGPVPAGLALEELSAVRARFLASLDAAPLDEALATFGERDRTLRSAADEDEVVLWFEWDLYDQLQLIQILDSLGESDRPQVSLVQLDGYLGNQTPETLARLYERREAVTDAQHELARRAWAAFRSPDPAALEAVVRGDTSALPFLGDALVRHLEQYPALDNGLARTERQILEAVAEGARDPTEVFLADQRREERVFMGDATLSWHLGRLSSGPARLVEPGGDRLRLTGCGRDVLAGRDDWIDLNGIDRWLGGVHLRGHADWRWDPESSRLAAP